MPKTMTLVRTASGLQSQFNQVNAEEGALLEATNVIIDREGVISKPRGFSRYGNPLPAAASSILEFEDRLVVHAGTTLLYDSDGAGTWTSYGEAISAPTSVDRIHGVEVNGTAILTTSQGVYRTDGLTTTPIRAGMPTGILPVLELTGDGLGMLPVDSAVGYRVIWGRVDKKNNLLLGAPSFRETVANAPSGTLNWSRSGGGPYTITVAHPAHGYTDGDWITVSNGSVVAVDGTHQITVALDPDEYTFELIADPGASGTLVAGKELDVTFTAQIPDEVVEGDFYEVYRTKVAVAATVDPTDRMYRIFRGGVTADDLTNEYVTFDDIWDDAFLGAELYTNANREGIGQQNSRPPWCRDIALFKGHVWYANTKKPHFMLLQLLTVSGVEEEVDTFTWTLGATSRTYTWSAAENVGNRKFERFDAELDSINIRKTAKSLCKVINEDAGNTLLWAYYVSGVDDPPGYIVLEARQPNTDQFTVTVNAGTPANVWSPELPSSGEDVYSDDDAGANRIYHSKFQVPEAVPDFNYDELGGRSNEIRRILPLRDSLIALCTEGVWRISGETDASFTITQLDPTVEVRAPEAAVVLNNSVYCLSTQGVVRITESGTSIVSRPIEGDLKDLFDESGYEASVFAVAYESERRYDLWTPLDAGKRIYTFNYLTRAWTIREKSLGAAHVMQDENVLYAAHGVDRYILKERKNFYAPLDHTDETIPVTIADVSSYLSADGESRTSVTLTWDTLESIELPDSGWMLTQGDTGAYVSLEGLTQVGETTVWIANLYLDREAAFVAGDAEISISIPSRVRWAPEVAETAAVLKQFTFAQVYLESDDALLPVEPWTYRLRFYSDIVPTEASAMPFNFSSLDGGKQLRSMVPRQHQVCRALSIVFEHNQAASRFVIANMATTVRMISDRTAKHA